MIKLLIFVIYCLYMVPAIDVNDYSWRDYYGEIPIDAISSTDIAGNKIYIGQALHMEPVNGKLIPGTIYEGKKQMEYYWEKATYTVDKNIKILCSHVPRKFIWIDVPNMAATNGVNETRLLVGGHESYNLFIGKIQKNGQSVIGKVTLYKAYEGMGFILDGKPDFTKEDFQVLSQHPIEEHFSH